MYRFRWVQQVRNVAQDGVLDAKQLARFGKLKQRTESRHVVAVFALLLIPAAITCVLAITYVGPTKDVWSKCSRCGQTLAHNFILGCGLPIAIMSSVPIIRMRSDANDNRQ